MSEHRHIVNLDTFEPGEPDGWLPQSEADHFIGCPTCAQPIDMRDLGAVLHHEEPGHHPLPALDAVRMVQGPLLRKALLAGWRPGAPAVVH